MLSSPLPQPFSLDQSPKGNTPLADSSISPRRKIGGHAAVGSNSQVKAESAGAWNFCADALLEY